MKEEMEKQKQKIVCLKKSKKKGEKKKMKKLQKMESKIFASVLSLLLLCLFVQMPVHAETIDEVWVNGVNISTTLDNTVQCGSGTAIYDKNTNTLTLNNAQITTANVAGYGIENKSNKDFNIILHGSNSINIPRTTGVFAYTEANMYFAGGGSLDIKALQSISNHKDITFDNVTITASTDADGSITSDGNITIKNEANVNCSGLYFGFNVLGDVKITDSTVNATATSENMNAFFIIGKITIEQNSDVTTTSYYPSLFSKSDINISDSSVKATSTADYGIWAKVNLTIAGNSEIISKGTTGSIGGGNSFKITPPLNEAVDVFLGTDSNNVTALEGSPFSAETDLKSLNIGTNKYFHSKVHTHIASATWSKDATNHWHECTADDGVKMDIASHTFDEWVIDTPATETTKGSKYRDCNICAQRETAEIPTLSSKDVIVDDTTGTKIEYEDGSVFGSDISLVVTPKTKEEMKKYQEGVDKVAKGLSIAGLYDIKLLKDGVEIQPNGKLKITLQLTKEMKNMRDLQVIYVDDNGNVTIIPSQLVDGKLVFVTDHFSYYGVIGKEKLISQIQPETPSKPNSPQTGDTSNIMLYFVLIVLSGFLAGYGFKKKKALRN